MNEFDHLLKQLGQQIETEIQEGRLNFPTAFDVSVRVKKLADNPDTTMDELARVVMAEPVLSAKAVRMANAVMLNPYGPKVTNVRDALVRIGLTALRCLAFAVAAEQLARDNRSPKLRMLASGLWLQTMDGACWAHAIAHRSRAAKADTAFFAAMMKNIGQFFVLARASMFPGVDGNIEEFARFVLRWHKPIRRSLIESFDLPDDIELVVNDDEARAPIYPQDLADVLAMAESVCATPNPFDRVLARQAPKDAAAEPTPLPEDVEQLADNVRELHDALLASLGN